MRRGCGGNFRNLAAAEREKHMRASCSLDEILPPRCDLCLLVGFQGLKMREVALQQVFRVSYFPATRRFRPSVSPSLSREFFTQSWQKRWNNRLADRQTALPRAASFLSLRYTNVFGRVLLLFRCLSPLENRSSAFLRSLTRSAEEEGNSCGLLSASRVAT